MEEFYQQINSFWSNPKSWQGTLKNIVLASIAGGSRDHVVRGDLTSLGNLTPFGKSVHVWSTSLPGVWIQMDHDAIVWCGQLIAVLSRAIMSLHSSTKHGKKIRKIYVFFHSLKLKFKKTLTPFYFFYFSFYFLFFFFF